MGKIYINLGVTKSTLEEIGQSLEYCESEIIRNFFNQVLKEASDTTVGMYKTAAEFAKVNPYCMGKCEGEVS